MPATYPFFLTYPIIVYVNTLLVSGTVKFFKVHLFYFLSQPYNKSFSRSSDSIYCRTVLEAKIWVLDILLLLEYCLFSVF